MRFIWVFLWFAIFSLASSLGLNAQMVYNADGVPFIRNYTPREYRAAEANWSVTSDHRGIMYFGNENRILEYDGKNWSPIPIPGQTFVRSLATGTDGTIYVGGTDDFGKLSVDETGEWFFYSLRHLVDEGSPILNIHKIYTYENTVYFAGLREVVVYDIASESAQIFSLSDHSLFSFFISNRLYFGDESKGLMLLDESSATVNLAKGGAYFAEKNIFSILPWNQDSLLIATGGHGLFAYNPTDGGISGFNRDQHSTFTNTLLSESFVYSATHFKDSLYFFGTMSNGLIVMNAHGKTLYVLNKDTGLQNDIVADVYVDPHQPDAVWMSLNYGIAAAKVFSPLKKHDSHSGLQGTIFSLAHFQNHLYVGTSQNAYVQQKDPSGNMIFQPVQPITGESVYDMLIYPITESDTEQLILGFLSTRLFGLVTPNTAMPVSDNNYTVNRLLLSKKHPGRLYVSTSRGIAAKTFRTGKLRLLPDNVFKRDNYRSVITRATEDDRGMLWCETLSGVLLLDTLGNVAALPEFLEDRNGMFFLSQGELFFQDETGVYKAKQDYTVFEESVFFKQHYFDKAKIIEEIFSLHDTLMVVSFLKNGEPFSDMVNPGNRHIDSLALRELPQMSAKIAFQKPPYLFVGGAEGLFVLNTKAKRPARKDFRVHIRNVVLNQDSVFYRGTGNSLETEIIQNQLSYRITEAFPFRFNNLSFQFAAPLFDREEALLYSSRLEGFDSQWSAWQHDPIRVYTNLSEGVYRFQVRAMDVFGNISDTTVFEFRILPPWYRSWWAYILYVLVSILVVFISVKLYTRKLEEDKRKLEEIVRQRTAEIVEKNKRIEHQNQHITDSIRYAQRIQTAVLPHKQNSSAIEHFLYFKPKDIVSGDFYWINHQEQENRVILVAADCTGHGVPGAFMSMLGTTFLNDISRNPEVKHSDQMLNLLRTYVIKALKQGVNDENAQQKDGMDLGLALIDLNTMKLEFSGANNPMLFIRNGEIEEYKADRMPIGTYRKQEVPFTRHEIPLLKGDVFYMFSDGYPDQFGGLDGKKYMKKNFREFVYEIHTLPFEIQHQALEEEMRSWMGEEHEQLDDQIVIGTKVL